MDITEFIFSIIIPTYNRPEILKKTLDCIERQNASFSYEVIVVDDCSIMSLPDLMFGKGKRSNWKLLRNEKNMGRAATRNRGIREAKGEYILMIDDDIWATPGLLQAHYDAQRRIGGVVVGAVPPSPEVANTVWNRYLSRRYERIQDRLQSEKLDYELFFTGNVSLPRSLFNEVGVFEESFKGYSLEDTEMGYRLYKAGIPFRHASDAVGYHMFEEDLSSLCNKAFHAGSSAYTFVKLHPEEVRNINYHSMTFGSWKGINTIKNVLKFFLFNRIATKIFVLLVRIGEIFKQDSIVFMGLPWVELTNMARGVKEARLEEKMGRQTPSRALGYKNNK